MINLYDPDINQSDINSVINALNKKELSGNTDSVRNFEKAISKFLGVKYVSSCSSGTAALHLALLSLDIGVGDEVIMPSLSYIATANSVSYVGARPVFVDVDSKTWQIDTNKIEEKITRKN
jgi:perosamine synthetase